MAVYDKPTVYDAALRQHHTISNGHELSPELIPVSAQEGNFIDRNADGLAVVAAKIVSADADNSIEITVDGKLFVTPHPEIYDPVSKDGDNIIHEGTDKGALLRMEELVSAEDDNALRVELDGKLFVTPHPEIYDPVSKDGDNIIHEGTDKGALLRMEELVSTEDDNALRVELDGKLFAPTITPPDFVSTDAGNIIHTDTSDGKLYVPAPPEFPAYADMLSDCPDNQLTLERCDCDNEPKFHYNLGKWVDLEKSFRVDSNGLLASNIRVVSADAGNLITSGSDDGAYLGFSNVVSTDGDNRIIAGTDGKLVVEEQIIVSAQPGNLIRYGNDQGAYIDGNDILSNEADNHLSLSAVDGRVFYQGPKVSEEECNLVTLDSENGIKLCAVDIIDSTQEDNPLFVTPGHTIGFDHSKVASRDPWWISLCFGNFTGFTLMFPIDRTTVRLAASAGASPSGEIEQLAIYLAYEDEPDTPVFITEEPLSLEPYRGQPVHIYRYNSGEDFESSYLLAVE